MNTDIDKWLQYLSTANNDEGIQEKIVFFRSELDRVSRYKKPQMLIDYACDYLLVVLKDKGELVEAFAKILDTLDKS